jgi:hypothetical protein
MYVCMYVCMYVNKLCNYTYTTLFPQTSFTQYHPHSPHLTIYPVVQKEGVKKKLRSHYVMQMIIEVKF